MRNGFFILLGIVGALGFGFGIGVTAERHWRISERAQAYRAQVGRMREATSDSGRRGRDPLQWQRDSIAQARFVALRFTAPREIGRQQAFRHCAVTFEIRDTTYRRPMLFNARAHSVRSSGGPVVAEGWTFSPSGWELDDTVSVVLPNVFCGDIMITGFGGSWAPPPRPLALEIR